VPTQKGKAMAKLKITSWNVEHFGRLLPNPADADRVRLDAIREEIEAIDPDILCLIESPGSLPDLQAWVESAHGLAGRYRIATIPGTQDVLGQNPGNPRAALQKLYCMQGTETTGNQWIWFLVRDGLFQESGAKVLNPSIWQNLTAQKRWPVHLWGQTGSKMHSHWRHPQTLLVKFGNVEIEVIGVHLKSKINMKQPFDAERTLKREYVDTALEARIKLATEAYDVRRYIEKRFEQHPNPRILVCGDMNDGPGRGYFEREYLFFDLVSNIQGDVFFAKRFLNHALFDYEGTLRWSTQFHDKIEQWSREQPGAEALPSEAIDTTRFQLIDHILFTQTLTGSRAKPRVRPHAGLMEHTTHQRINALLPSSSHTSDHTPISVLLDL